MCFISWLCNKNIPYRRSFFSIRQLLSHCSFSTYYALDSDTELRTSLRWWVISHNAASKGHAQKYRISWKCTTWHIKKKHLIWAKMYRNHHEPNILSPWRNYINSIIISLYTCKCTTYVNFFFKYSTVKLKMEIKYYSILFPILCLEKNKSLINNGVIPCSIFKMISCQKLHFTELPYRKYVKPRYLDGHHAC